MAIREGLILYQQDPHVIDSTEGLVIFSDSKSAIEAIRNGETNISCDIITLLEQLHNKRKSCIMQWIPAHVNIEGHEDSHRQDTVTTKLLKMGMVPLRDSLRKSCSQNSRGSDEDFRRNLAISTAFIHGHENNNNSNNEQQGAT
ncbi:hypothetical protein TNCV_3086251 [Trichonephila clavipes]|nr:hypothetical protein TNCV_3086251 [Trichonephila clavipes]